MYNKNYNLVNHFQENLFLGLTTLYKINFMKTYGQKINLYKAHFH